MDKEHSKLVQNLKFLLSESGLSSSELAKLAKIPKTTIYTILSGNFEPKLSTLRELAKFFNVNISQLLGEIALNYNEIKIPVLSWRALNTATGEIEFVIKNDTKFISVSHESSDPLYALILESDIYTKYKKGSILIFSHSESFNDGDVILISVNKTPVVLKKAIFESNITYLTSMSEEIPAEKYSEGSSKVFGVIKEIRMLT